MRRLTEVSLGLFSLLSGKMANVPGWHRRLEAVSQYSRRTLRFPSLRETNHRLI